MNFRDISLKKAYSSDLDDILHDFYIPVLKASIEYDRLAGFFSSTSLAIAAKGILELIKNEGTMKFIVSPRLNKEDLEILMNSYKDPKEYIEIRMLEELEKLEEDFVKDHVGALGWMVANKKLEIKVAIVYNNEEKPLSYDEIQQSGLFHQKVGVLKDLKENIITFSGSVNETATSWLENIEEFKVFRSWVSSEEDYIRADISKFNRFWNNQSTRVKLIDIPHAVEKRLIEIAPKNIEKINLQKWYKRIRRKKIELFQYQKDAINAWFKNDMKGIFEMATGTGKTFAALDCLERILEKEEKLVTVISCPYSHLARQWLNNINKYGIICTTIIADSSNYRWKDNLMNNILDIRNEITDKLIVLTTHVTFAKDNFTTIIKKANTKLFLIADEVHGVGAPKRKKGLIEDYSYRLGLSATPKRWFDLEGTEKLFDYFGGSIFEFSLKKALNTINPATGRTFLVPYEYKPYFVELTEEELNRYEEETKKIAKAYHKSKNDEEKDKWFSLLLIKRQKIIKNAIKKFNAFKEILDEIDEIKDCLVYCSPQQIIKVQDILNSYRKQNIIQHKFTQEEGTTPEKKYGELSKRDFLLKGLAEGEYHVLVAMKCLDEGVDVPQVKIGIILSSTGNPRQYIQRRGRILRRFPGKRNAIIFDIIVVPSFSSSISSDLLELEKKIIIKELKRYKEFAFISNNPIECLNKIENLENKYNILV